MRKMSHNFYVTSALILSTTGAFIMEMEYANESSISEAEELNIPTVVLPFQFEPTGSSSGVDNRGLFYS